MVSVNVPFMVPAFVFGEHYFKVRDVTWRGVAWRGLALPCVALRGVAWRGVAEQVNLSIAGMPWSETTNELASCQQGSHNVCMCVCVCVCVLQVVGGENSTNHSVVFRPNEWRGISDNNPQTLDIKKKAAEVNGYPLGTVSAIYVTSDGGVRA